MTADDQVPESGRNRVALVIGSTRANRICPGIARWVLRVVQVENDLLHELVDSTTGVIRLH